MMHSLTEFKTENNLLRSKICEVENEKEKLSKSVSQLKSNNFKLQDSIFDIEKGDDQTSLEMQESREMKEMKLR